MARDAPEEFQQVVVELSTLRVILASDMAGMRMKVVGHGMIEEAIRTLESLSELVARFHNLAAKETGSQYESRLEWDTIRMEIRELNKKLQDKAEDVDFVMSEVAG